MARLVRAALTHAGRLFGIALAVTLAVGLVSGTFILTDTIASAFQAATVSPNSTSDIVVRATAGFTAQANSLPEREPLPESLLARVAAVPGIQALWPTVQGYAAMIDKAGKSIAPDGLPTIGTSWAPGDVLDAGRAPRPGEVAIDTTTARRYHLHLGDNIRILFQGGEQSFTIAGVLRRSVDVVAATKATFDPDTATHWLGQKGQINAIAVKAQPGSTPAAIRARINAVLPPRFEAVTAHQVADEAAQSWTKSLAFLSPALLLLAGVALVVGALLIANTFSILVGQRTRELGLLRALGASPAQLRRLVLAEATAVGLSASLAGIAIGFGAAHGMLALIRGAGLAVPASSVVFRARSALAGVICGVTVTMVAAFLPARRATLVSPVAALNGRETRDDLVRAHRIGPGAAATLTGAVLLAAGSLHALPTIVASAVGAGAILIGLALLLPVLAGPAASLISAPLVRLFGQPASLARQNAVRNSRRTAATAAALMIGIGLVGVIAIVTASMKASATKAVRETLRADLVVMTNGSAGSSGGLPASVAERLRHTPEVGVVSEIRAGQWGLGDATETLLAIDPATVTRMHEVDAASTAAVRRLDDTGVLVRDTVAEHHGWRIGDLVPMTFARTGTRRLPIRGLFSTMAVRTDYVISLESFAANYAQPLTLVVDVKLAKGFTPGTAEANVRKVMSDLPVAKVMDRSQLLASQQAQIDKYLSPVAALLGLSVLIGLLGIANALALSIHERTRELGLLRAVGMARSQLRSMIRCEAVVIAAFGSLLGLGLAVGFGWACVTAVRDLGVTELVLPVGQLGILVGAATAAGLLAAIVPARRAANLQVLDALGDSR
ncbi:MAG: putative transport system permease protein [Acidimicrobiaceae bacterium]|nr:putative transport system permease protein [Acidimicrobiaceae bacterium]